MSPGTAAPANEVHLVGRVSGEPTVRSMPSGDELVQFRLVVPRPGRRGDKDGDKHGDKDGDKDRDREREGSRTQVDTIDIACWPARVRRAATRLPDGQGVEVTGSLRRRFFATATGRASRYEVDATSLRRVDLGA